MIPADIEDITAGATYQGMVYDQYVTSCLPTGIEVEVFDPTVTIASENDIGQRRNATILLHLMDDPVAERLQCGVKQVNDALELVGEIVELAVDDEWHVGDGYQNLIRVRIDSGTVLVNPTGEAASRLTNEEIKCGDLLHVVPYMVTLVDLCGA